MLWDDVWKRAWGGVRPPDRDPNDPRQPLQLCFACLEKRLGRPLTRADFNSSSINEYWFR